MASADPLAVQVVYALPDRQAVVALRLPAATSVERAIAASGLLQRFPEIDLRRHVVGVFGRAVGLDTPLRDGDRVEIYRPLQVDPREARRRRAAG